MKPTSYWGISVYGNPHLWSIHQFMGQFLNHGTPEDPSRVPQMIESEVLHLGRGH